jgi:DNA polymerase III delta' subunit
MGQMRALVSGDFLPAVPGQELAKAFFARALALGRLSHAYLLVGPAGSGKRLFARELAKALFCREGAPCGACGSCRSIEHGNHPDVHFFRPAEGKSIVDIDTVRALCERTHLKSEHLQVAILEEADRLNEPAANALLKTLEEPPGRILLLLLAQSTGTMLSTIVSRCQRLPLGASVKEAPAVAGERRALLMEALAPDFFARSDVRVWLRSTAPEETTLKGALGILIEMLLSALRPRGGVFHDERLDDRLRLLEILLDLRQDLDRNVNPDLVVERLLVALRDGRAAGALADAFASPPGGGITSGMGGIPPA